MEKPEDGDLGRAGDEMKHALNATWRRPTLGKYTAEEEWRKRQPLRIDRAGLRDRVEKGAERLRADDHLRDREDDVVMRFAIEFELMKRGLSSQRPGGWC